MVLEFTYTPEDLAEAAKAESTALSKDRPKARGRHLFGWLLFIGLAVMLFMLLSSNQTRRGAAPPPTTAPQESLFVRFLLPLLPWVLIFGFIWFFVFRQLRRTSERVWQDNPALQQQQTMQVDADGVRLSTPLADTTWRWANFVGVSETANLLLLRMSNATYLVIPKRAAAQPAQLAELRALLDCRASPQTNAFPVLPVPPAPGAPEAQRPR